LLLILSRVRVPGKAKYPPFLPIQSQASARSFYFPFNKRSRPSIPGIPGRAIPVTEVFKWQPQPKLK
jgi:hypothetical protein